MCCNNIMTMEAYTFCQSCGIPLDRPEVLGTERDHSRSTIYCVHCYRDGAFADAEMTLDEMEDHVREGLRKVNASDETIREAVARLPYLSRWLGIPAIHHSYEWH